MRLPGSKCRPMMRDRIKSTAASVCDRYGGPETLSADFSVPGGAPLGVSGSFRVRPLLARRAGNRLVLLFGRSFILATA